MVYDTQKELLIEKLLEGQDIQSCIVFVSTKKNVRSIAQRLSRKGWKAAAISSDLEQKEREEVLGDFRNRKYNFLVATDILSRGIDIEDIQVVVNYEVPRDPEDYVHRIGRTARAGASGRAITFVNPDGHAGLCTHRKTDRTFDIEKPPLPASVGEGPEYDPKLSRFAAAALGGPKPGGGRNSGGGGSRPRPEGQGGNGKPRNKKRRKPGGNSTTGGSAPAQGGASNG
jgi:ATP-dependent RNA helicase RhlE